MGLRRFSPVFLALRAPLTAARVFSTPAGEYGPRQPSATGAPQHMPGDFAART